MFTSEQLTEGEIYTRNDLREQFNIKDATINTGVFRPSGYRSIWLFVTEKKAKDLEHLQDRLEGDTLYWDGQPSGRTDAGTNALLIVNVDNTDLAAGTYSNDIILFPSTSPAFTMTLTFALA